MPALLQSGSDQQLLIDFWMAGIHGGVGEGDERDILKGLVTTLDVELLCQRNSLCQKSQIIGIL